MLSAGQVLQVYTKGTAKACHVLVAPDWKSIVWQDPKNGKKIGALDLRAVGAVHAGVDEGHKCVPGGAADSPPVGPSLGHPPP
jgi:hypothetical protein